MADARTHPSLRGRVAVVTGGSRGLGRAMAVALVEAGARVAILGSSESPQLAETMSMAAARGAADRIAALVGDVGNARDCERICREVADRLGPIDVLINNAGVPMTGPGEPFWQVGVDAWHRMVSANVDGPFLMARCAVPGMIERRHGRIVNVSTSDRTMARRNFSPYGPSKAFLEACSRIWAQELDGTGVTVNVLAPGGVVDTQADVTGVPSPNRASLPPTVMCAPALWLASDLSNGHSGQRFIASLWDESLPLDQRVTTARQDGAELPRIM